jgi:type II secretory pathway component PulF
MDDLVLFTQHLSSAVRAGVPLHQTVELLAGEMVGRGFRKALSSVAAELRTGATLAESLAKHPGFFPDYYLTILRVGEEAGTLPDTMRQLADLLQKNFIIGRKLKKVFAYPIAILSLLLMASVLYGTFIIPQFMDIYKELHAQIPAPLQFLLRFQYRAFTAAIVIIGVVFWMARRFARVGWCGLMFDKFDLNCPVLGVFTRYAIASRLSRALGTMLRSGIPLPEAMTLCGKMLNNEKARQSIEAVRNSVERGETLGTSMLSESLFPPTMIWLLSAAEVKGDFIGTLDQLADFYNAKVENTALWVLEILEPMLILVVGGLLIALAAGLYSPVFSLVDAIGN